MMKKIVFLFIGCLLGLSLQAQQQATLNGKVFSNGNREALQGASVNIIRLGDKQKIASGVTKSDGTFKVSALPVNDSLRIDIAFLGHEGFQGIVYLKEPSFRMAPVYLNETSRSLKEVVIKAARPMMVVNADTTEFNAENFRTPPNGKAQDLIKRIPGITIGAGGRLLFNGNPINKILVDGMPFFGESGSIALANIPVELIDKIQVHDLYTSQERKFQAKEQQGQQTLNIKLKAGRKYFGNAQAGTGSSERYEFNGMASYAKGRDRISLLGATNNTNMDVQKPVTSGTVGMGSRLNSSEGLARNKSFGADFQQRNTNANYLCLQQGLSKFSTTERRQSVLDNGSLFSMAISNQNKQYLSHNIDFQAKFWKFEKIMPHIDYDDQRDQTTYSYITRGNDGAILSSLERNSTSAKTGLNTAFRFALKSPKTKKDLSYSVFGVVRYASNEQREVSKSVMDFYLDAKPDSQAVVSQRMLQKSIANRLAISGNLGYRLSEKLSLDFVNAIQLSRRRFLKNTWDANSGMETKNANLSNDFTSLSLHNTFMAGFRYVNERDVISPSLTIIGDINDQRSLVEKDVFHNNQLRVVPTFYFSRGFGKMGRIKASYELNPNQPTIEQLQPVQDNANPLFLKVGNPNLLTEFMHAFELELKMPMDRPRSAISGGRFFYYPIQNKIIPYLSYDSLGRQISSFRNAVGVYSLHGEIGKQFTFKKGDCMINASISLQSDLSKDKVYVKEILNGTSTVSFGGAMDFSLSLGDVLNTTINYSPFFNQLSYQYNTAASQDYRIDNLNASAELYLFRRIRWNNSATYTYNNGLPPDAVRSSFLWNSEVSLLCLKNRKLSVKLKAYDILQQNRNIDRIIGSSFVEDTQVNTLQRYFLFSLSYDFNRLFKPGD